MTQLPKADPRVEREASDDVLGRVGLAPFDGGERWLLRNGKPFCIVAAPDQESDALRALPFELCRKPRALVIGVGGGFDVLLLSRYTDSIVGVEASPAVHLLMSADALCPAYRLARVVRAEGRAFLESTQGLFDLIVLAWADTNPNATGIEAGLYTKEAFELYARRLTDRGLLLIVHGPEVIERAAAALRLSAEEDQELERKVLAYSAERVVRFGSSRASIKESFLLFKKDAFSKGETALLASEIAARGGRLVPAPELFSPDRKILPELLTDARLRACRAALGMFEPGRPA